MTLPSNLNALIKQLDNELDNLEGELSESIEIVRFKISSFPKNMILIQLFATLNNYALFAENTRKRIQETVKYSSSKSLSDEELQEVGEDLSEQLGRILEAKIIVNTIKKRLSE